MTVEHSRAVDKTHASSTILYDQVLATFLNNKSTSQVSIVSVHCIMQKYQTFRQYQAKSYKPCQMQTMYFYTNNGQMELFLLLMELIRISDFRFPFLTFVWGRTMLLLVCNRLLFLTFERGRRLLLVYGDVILSSFGLHSKQIMETSEGAAILAAVPILIYPSSVSVQCPLNETFSVPVLPLCNQV